MIDFKFRVCYDFTGVTEEEIERLSEYDLMLNPCIRYVRVLLERPLETVYLYKIGHTSNEGVLSYYWMYANDSTGMDIVSVRQLLDSPVPFNYNKHQVFII